MLEFRQERWTGTAKRQWVGYWRESRVATGKTKSECQDACIDELAKAWTVATRHSVVRTANDGTRFVLRWVTPTVVLGEIFRDGQSPSS